MMIVVWSDEYFRIVVKEESGKEYYLVVLPDGQGIPCESLEEAKSVVERERRRQRRRYRVYSERGFRVYQVEEGGETYFVVIYPGGKEVRCGSLEEAKGIIRREVDDRGSFPSLP